MGKNYNNKSAKYSKKPYAGKKEYAEKRDCDQSKDRRTYEDHTSNAIEWWNRATGVYGLATRVPFTKLSGTAYNMKDSLQVAEPGSNDQYDDANYALPTMMRIQYVPGVGIAEHAQDAANMAFSAMYQALYSKTSGILDFAPFYVAMYTTCAQSIAQNFALLKRALETANLYAVANRSFPFGLLRTLGFEPQDLIDNQVQYAWKLNTRIKLFNSFLIPNTIDVFARHYSLARNIWADQDDIRAQFYAFVPEVYYLYNDLGTIPSSGQETGIARADAYQFKWADGSSLMTFDEVLSIIDEQLNALRSSADFARLTGFLQKAFTESSFLKIDEYVPGSIRIPNVNDKVMLYQIHNMYCAGQIPVVQLAGNKRYAHTCCITGDPVANLLLYKPTVSTEEGFTEAGLAIPDGNLVYTGCSTDGHIMNFFSAEDVTDDMIMEASRLMSQWKRTGYGNKQALYIGTEFVTKAFIYSVRATDHASVEKVVVPALWQTSTRETLDGPAPVVTSNYTLKDVTLLTKFHMAPRVHLVSAYTTKDAADDDWTFTDEGIVGDLLYWNNITSHMLEGLHTAAILSIFDIDKIKNAAKTSSN